MEILTILSLKHSGLGNPLHVQVMDIIRKHGYGIELHDWCVDNKVGATYDEKNCTISIKGKNEFSFQCTLLVYPKTI